MMMKLILAWILVLVSLSSANGQAKGCKNLASAKPVTLPVPEYPLEAKNAKIEGRVEVKILIDEKGEVISSEPISGNPAFFKTSIEAARKARYSPTVCDDKPQKTDGIIAFDFVLPKPEEYFLPSRIEDFADIRREDQFYEALVNLTENSRIGYGYSDKNFHGEMPLSRGDFAEFLKQTLDFLDRRAEMAKANRKEIPFYRPMNPLKLKSAAEIRDLNEFSPYAGALKILVEKYEIAPVDKLKNFNGASLLTAAEAVDLWRGIFGEDAVPVNFQSSKSKQITRGEFAIFLSESLDVLTYKMLP